MSHEDAEAAGVGGDLLDRLAEMAGRDDRDGLTARQALETISGLLERTDGKNDNEPLCRLYTNLRPGVRCVIGRVRMCVDRAKPGSRGLRVTLEIPRSMVFRKVGGDGDEPGSAAVPPADSGVGNGRVA